LQADAHDLLQAGWTFPVELLLERDTVHELHHQVRGPVCFFDGMDGNDVLVTDGGGSPGLAREALARRAADGHFGGKDLDGDHAAQLLVEALEHHAHAATANDFQDLVMIESAQRIRPLRRGQEARDWDGRVAAGTFSLSLVAFRAIRLVAVLRGAISRSAGFVCDVARERLLHEAADLRMGIQQPLHLAAQIGVVPASLVEVGGPLGRAGFSQGGEEDRFCRR
jgi:hypothetical protein